MHPNRNDYATHSINKHRNLPPDRRWLYEFHANSEGRSRRPIDDDRYYG